MTPITPPPATMPSVFLSHGTPMLALADDAYTQALQKFFSDLPKPKAIVVVSAHGLSVGTSNEVEISIGKTCHAFHDFGGFPSELYQMTYSCPGAPDLSARLAQLLAGAGFAVSLDGQSRIDHGVWIPLKVIYPAADIPVVQVSIPHPAKPELILKLGRTMADLRKEGILLLGSGGAVHNLRKLQWHGKDSSAEPWVLEFQSWLVDQLLSKNVDALVHFKVQAPHAELAHPTDEHFLPILFAVGAALQGDRAVPIYQGVQYKALSMLSFALMAQTG